MTRSVMTLSLVLITGAVIGSSVVYFALPSAAISSDHLIGKLIGKNDNAAPVLITTAAAFNPNNGNPARAGHDDGTDAETAADHAGEAQDESIEKNATTAAAELQAPARDLVSLQAQLTAEAAARRSLEIQLSDVKDTLRQLQQKLEKLDRPPQPARRSGNDGQIDEVALITAGVPADYAGELAQRLNQRAMDLLYLRDQAIREDWIDTPRYREEAQTLRSSTTSLREELGADAYDRYLYASGQPNRVIVSSVIGSSPAELAGLQNGDRIVSYDGNRIFSPNDLRNATTQSQPEDQVVMQVDRGGQIVEYFLPAGPIGVHLDVDNVEP